MAVILGLQYYDKKLELTTVDSSLFTAVQK
jgi:hypothetical protein